MSFIYLSLLPILLSIKSVPLNRMGWTGVDWTGIGLNIKMSDKTYRWQLISLNLEHYCFLSYYLYVILV